MTTKKEEHRNHVREEVSKPKPPTPPEHLGDVRTDKDKPDPFATPEDSHPQNPAPPADEK